VTNRVLVLGLDGTTFDLIEPWAAQGLLPNFRHLMDRGAWGRLESTTPPVTAVAWNTFATGTNPGKHGVFDFVRRDASGYGVHVVNGSERKATPFWRILDRRGLHTGVISMPMCYPPDHLEHGFVVAGFDAPGLESEFAYPPEFTARLRRLGYRMHANTVNRQAWGKDLLALFDAKRRVFWELYHSEPWDLLFMVFMQMDAAQHLFWKDMEVHTPGLGEVIPRLYQQCDALLGQVMGTLRAEDLLVVVSDHGAGPLVKSVSINQWLCREGFLTLRKQSTFRTALNKSLLRTFVMLSKYLPKPVKTRLKSRFGWVRDGVESYLLSSRVDWSRTSAFALGEFGGVYINLQGRESQGTVARQDYDRLRNEIAARLLTLRDPENGRQVIQRVYRREEVYSGPHVDQAPDLVLEWDYAYDCRERVGSEHHDVFERESAYRAFTDHKKTGVHRKHGILLMYGPQVQPGQLRGPRLVDLAPTLLHALGVPIPNDMDGHVLTEALQPEWITSHPIRFQESQTEADGPEPGGYTQSEEEQVKQHLRSLGYLD